MVARPSNRMVLGLQWTDFDDVIFQFFEKYVEEIEVLLKCDMYNGSFT
jgi:hypothetical protein